MKAYFDLSKVIANENSSIKDVIHVIDKNGLRIAYIVNNRNILIGIVTDSEIRKAIIKGIDVNEQVNKILNTTPIFLKESDLLNSFSVQKIVINLLQRMPDSTYILVVDRYMHPKKLILLRDIVNLPLVMSNKIGKKSHHILVVGGAGYLGSVVVMKLLAKGYKVRVLDNLLYGADHLQMIKKNKNFSLIEGDMRNIATVVDSLQGIDAVINLAAIVGDPACKNKPEQTIQTNYLANKSLAEACKYQQINRYIYASTCSVYGQMQGEDELTEDSPLNPVSLYARSKIYSEHGIMSLQDENFAPTILRMSTLYGYSPRMRFDLVVNTMTKNALLDKKIIIHGGGKQWRPLLHVEDAANAYVTCIEASFDKIKGKIFNVGSTTQNFQIITIAKQVKEIIPKAKMVMVGETQDKRNYAVSFKKIEHDLGYKVSKKLDNAIIKMKNVIEKGIIKDPNNKIYYNVANTI